jgi:hypothetical protein
MNRKNLTAAVLAGLAGVAGIAGTAQAVNMNPDGLGQVLIYPYYTANDGNQTILSVVNTTDNAKAIKVRFLEGFNSREVLDFNLYMSAYDVWVAAIAATDPMKEPREGGAVGIIIPDSSCTVPYLYDAEMGYGVQEFLDLAYTGDYADGGPTSMGRAAEGHFEMIEMGTLTGVAATNVTHEDANEDGLRLPLDCESLTDWWTDDIYNDDNDGLWFAEANENDDCEPYPGDIEDLDFSGCQAESYTTRASGGLFGAAAVIDAENGTMYSYDAKALQGFDDTDDGIHFIPGTIFPSLNSGSISESWVFFGVPQNQAVNLDYTNTVDAVSSVFMHETVMNEYTTEEELGAATEWVVTFPTKNFYADEWRMVQVGLIDDPADGMPGDNVTCDTDDDGDYVNCVAHARAPFTELFGDADCEVVSLAVWDREEAEPADPDSPTGVRPPVVSPSLPVCNPDFHDNCAPEVAPFQICTEVNILRFGEGVVFDSPTFEETVGEGDDAVTTEHTIVHTVDSPFVNGWAKLNLGGTGRVDENGLLGLPVTGFAAYEFENEFLSGGVKANYGGLFQHKGNVRMGASVD